MYTIIKKLFCLNSFSEKIITHLLIKFEGGVWRSLTLRRLYKECYNVKVGYGSYGWVGKNIEGPVVIGNYSSIGPGVKRLAVNHIIDGVSSHPCYFNPCFGWIKKDPRKRTELIIGNDVWIGTNVIILPSVKKIGDGAIVGAGAVVSKDVAPYSIVGGIPAKEIRKRFKEELATKISRTQWWNLSEKELYSMRDLFCTPEKFIEKIYELNLVHE